jgi:hypothetical protein
VTGFRIVPLEAPEATRPLCDACGTEPAAVTVYGPESEKPYLDACARCLFVGVEEVAEKRPPEATVRVFMDLRAEGYTGPVEIGTALQRVLSPRANGTRYRFVDEDDRLPNRQMIEVLTAEVHEG